MEEKCVIFSPLFKSVTKEARELYLPNNVFEYTGRPSALEFYRNWVSPNIPVVFKSAISEWPALHKWNDPLYLRKQLGEKEVNVAVTPNGLADAVYDGKFVVAEERKMCISEFLDILDLERSQRHQKDQGLPKKDEDAGIFYIQKQNGNFIEEFPELHGDAATDISWATEAFGKSPDAVNFWMGDSRAMSSLHKDYYENLYCVISGEKIFTLYPPTDLPYIPYCNYQRANFKQNCCGKFEVIDDPSEPSLVPWIPVDPLNPDFEIYPEFRNAKPVTCKVGAGDVLYLPSLWFHHVQQTHATIAINFWYDMEFDIKYNYFRLLENMVQIQK